MSALELKVYDIFKAKFRDEEAGSVREYFEEKTSKQFDNKNAELATKEDIIRKLLMYVLK
jgi:hypothetical protein